MNTAFSRVGSATLAAALLVVSASAEASTLSFSSPHAFTGAWSVAVGDFNRDGEPDLAGTNRNIATLSVQLGNGDGTFGPGQSFATGDTPLSTAVADLNRDGAADLAVANCGQLCSGSGPGNVSVLLGNGDGTFGAKTDLVTGTGPTGVAAADLNRDGKSDLVSANAGSGSVSVLLGNGDGTFGPKTDFTVGGHSIAVGDLNRDGKPDLSVASGGAISVLLGNGDGTFGPKTDYPARLASGVAIGDLNADGAPDLVAPNDFDANVVSVLLGNGDGTFRARTDYSTVSDTCADVVHTPFCGGAGAAIADLNADGKRDLAVANARATRVAVLLGKGDGTFGPKREFDAGGGANAIAAADLDLDGRPDLVTNGVALLNTSADGAALAVTSLTASRKGIVKLPLRNRNPFRVTGNVTLRTASGKPITTLGRASFAVAAAKTSSVSVKLSKAGAALLAKRKTVRARVALVTRAPGAPAITSAKVLRLTAR